MPIRNIIFDLGNVIIDIDPTLTAAALIRLAGSHLGEAQKELTISGFYHPYEMGKIDDTAFIETLKKFAEDEVTQQQIIDAWNAMLLQIPCKRIDLLKTLKEEYKLFVLSNTNHFHIEGLNSILYNSCGVHSIESIMDKCYYSHQVGYRKPMKEIFQLVINEQNLNPEHSLFIDDLSENIDMANQIGLVTRHNPSGTCITSWLPEFLAKFK